MDDEGPGTLQSVLRWRPADPGGGVLECGGPENSGGHQVCPGLPALSQDGQLWETAVSSSLAAGSLGSLQCQLWAGAADPGPLSLQAAALSLRLHPRLPLPLPPGLHQPARPDREAV